MFFSAYTLGCKLNQLETEAIVDSFRREGFSFVPWEQRGPAEPGSDEPGSSELGSKEPTIMVINSCTVTSMAEQKARRVIRKALREHPESCLIVTGCYAQLEKAALAALADEAAPGTSGASSGRLFIVPGEMKDRLMDLPRFISEVAALPAAMSGTDPSALPTALPELISSWLASASDTCDGSFRFLPEQFASHSRGFLKIQDGCDHRCAYCRVSIARGKSRSFPAAEALEALQSLERRGFGEAVLTGVNITQYRDSGMALPELLDYLLGGTERIRLRLSSIEPDFFTSRQNSEEFLRLLANRRIRPHFHLSLQSGSAEILSKMGRSYTPGDVEEAVKLIRSAKEDPFLACDIIAGFPGESADEFEETKELCERIGFAWIHAFPFSPRPGTAAYNFPNRVSERDAAKRVELLTGLARKGRREYLRRWEGKEVEAVVEKGGGSGSGSLPAGLPDFFVSGVSENYLKLLIRCGEDPIPAPGTLVRCRILPASPGPQKPGDQIDALAERLCF